VATALCRWLWGTASRAAILLGFLLGLALAGYLSAEQGLPLGGGKTMRLSGPTLDGGRFDLADHRGEVVLVDFWASWCRPCIEEMPNVRAAHDKYHDQGLTVVAVSLDFTREALEKFLADHPEPWPQIYFDEEGQRGFDNPLARRYNVQGIPWLLVFDREGKLAARNVRGPEIAVAVGDALGHPVGAEERLASTRDRVVGWLIIGVAASSRWLLVLCGLGGAAVLALADAGLRRLFREPLVRDGDAVRQG
jgi:thiol-disulfide isomerase/thioredoxin